MDPFQQNPAAELDLIFSLVSIIGMHISRRKFTASLGAGIASSFVSLKAFAREKFFGYPLDKSKWDKMAKNLPYGKYFSSQEEEIEFEIELPRNLAGKLEGTEIYRVGPGLYHRGKQKKPMILDADGMIRETRFKNGLLRFRNRHIRTPKWMKEESFGTYQYPSFAQILPQKGMYGNSTTNIKNQASVATIQFGGKLYVTDEIQKLSVIKKDNLEFEKEWTYNDSYYFAHSKIDVDNNWLCLMNSNAMEGEIQIQTFDSNMNLVAETRNHSTHSRMVHDWFMTKNYFVIYLPSMEIDTTDAMQAWAGQKPIAHAFHYKKNLPAKLLVIDRKTGKNAGEFDIPPQQAWHGVNAYEEGDTIYVDLIGAANPPSLSDPQSSYYSYLKNDKAVKGDPMGTSLNRYRIAMAQKLVHADSDLAVHDLELPTIPLQYLGKPYTYFYAMGGAQFLAHRITKVNRHTGEQDSYEFGLQEYVSEPLLVPTGDGEDEGYLVVEVHDGNSKLNRIVLFDAQNVSAGPVFQAELPVGLPICFHGSVNFSQ